VKDLTGIYLLGSLLRNPRVSCGCLLSRVRPFLLNRRPFESLRVGLFSPQAGFGLEPDIWGIGVGRLSGRIAICLYGCCSTS
jgi:hypothetical protein